MDNMDKQTSAKLEEIAKKLGTSVSKLLESQSPKQIIEAYEKGELRMLND